MQRLATYLGRELTGRCPNLFKRAYELRAGDELVASLVFRSAWGTLATAEAGDGCWSFKRVGFFNTRVTVHPCEGENELAVFRNKTWSSGGTLEFPDGRKYPVGTNFWMNEFDIRTPEGLPLVHYKNSGLMGNTLDITLQPQAGFVPEISMIALLGWYLVIMIQSDAIAGAAAAAGD